MSGGKIFKKYANESEKILIFVDLHMIIIKNETI